MQETKLKSASTAHLDISGAPPTSRTTLVEPAKREASRRCRSHRWSHISPRLTHPDLAPKPTVFSFPSLFCSRVANTRCHSMPSRLAPDPGPDADSDAGARLEQQACMCQPAASTVPIVKLAIRQNSCLFASHAFQFRDGGRCVSGGGGGAPGVVGSDPCIVFVFRIQSTPTDDVFARER